MNRNNTVIAVVLSLLFSVCNVNAQRTATVTGVYTYRVPSDVSIDEAKTRAVERARLQAIADEFGTIVDMTNMTEVTNIDGDSHVEMFSHGESEVKGEWLSDISDPEFAISYEQGNLIVTATVRGKVREIVGTDIDFRSKVLCNGVDDRFESYEFNSGDQIYLSFLSPIDGYLAVYLFDGKENVYCLLPYRSQDDDCLRIRRNKRCVLFSPKDAPEGLSPEHVGEYTLETSNTKEINQLYIIFSPNRFNTPLYESVEGIPSMDYESFQKWLTKCRNRDAEMKVERKSLTIKNNK